MAVEGSSYKEADAPPLPGVAEYHDGSATESGTYLCRRCSCIFCFCMYLKPSQMESASVLTFKVRCLLWESKGCVQSSFIDGLFSMFFFDVLRALLSQTRLLLLLEEDMGVLRPSETGGLALKMVE